MIDGHIHYAETLKADRVEAVIGRYQLKGIGVLCIPAGEQGTEPDALALRAGCSVPVYVFGGIPRSVYYLPKELMQTALVEAVKEWMRLGCTGIKMLEGKPQVRKAYPVPDFDDAVWEPYWAYLENGRIPLYFHVNDPEEFWDETRISRHALESGWLYDETYVNNEDQYRQVLRVLERHPGLKVVFPHFFFMSGQLERLRQILDRFPGVRIDIAPGQELYHHLSRQGQKARAFFNRYQDRILYGTDIGARELVRNQDESLCMAEAEARIALIRRFLETEGEYVLDSDGYYVTDGPHPMNGLGLPEEMLEKIYQRNFLDLIQVQRPDSRRY